MEMGKNTVKAMFFWMGFF